MTHSVLIVEDDLFFRSRFVHALREVGDLLLAGEAGDLGGGMELLHELRPDVLLVDIDLPNGSGLALIREAAMNVPHCDVMIAARLDDVRHVQASIEAGAMGCLLKDAGARDLAAQIRELRAMR